MDCKLSSHSILLTLYWTEIAQCRVTVLRVVEALNIVEKIEPGLITSSVDLVPDPLSFERGEEAFHCRIVPDITRSAHRAVDTIG